MTKVFYRNVHNGRQHSCPKSKWEVLKGSIIGKNFALVKEEEVKAPKVPKNITGAAEVIATNQVEATDEDVKEEEKDEDKPVKEPAKHKRRKKKK